MPWPRRTAPGADSIDDLDVLRHGGMAKVFGGVRAPSTLDTFLRSFTFGHVRQVDAVASRTLAGLAAAVPRVLAGATDPDGLAYLDVDDTIREVHGPTATTPSSSRPSHLGRVTGDRGLDRPREHGAGAPGGMITMATGRHYDVVLEELRRANLRSLSDDDANLPTPDVDVILS